MKEFDICVIGSGAGGSVVSKVFAEKGWNVAIIEQGNYIVPGTNIETIMDKSEKAYARDSEGNWGLNGYPWTASAVGGGTIFYAGVSFRYKDVDFNARNHIAKDALDPKWPINYKDLDEYYNEIEQWLGVSGDLLADPFVNLNYTGKLEQPHEYSQQGELIHAAGKKLGLHPFHTPLAINKTPQNGFPGCERLTSCTDYSCPIGAKSDSFTRILKPILQQDNIVLMKNTKALRLIQNQSSKIDSLECIDLNSKELFNVNAKHFILAGNAIQSAALVLRSTNKWWPNGIGNKSGLVGSGLSFKVSEFVSGWVENHGYKSVDTPLKSLYSTASITDYYLDNECPSGLGGLIYESNPSKEYSHDGKSVFVQLECILGDQPLLTNKVRLSPKLDSFGTPRIILDYQTHELDAQRLQFLKEKAKNILKTMGAEKIQFTPSNYFQGSAHLHGTCRSGVDEDISVVDKLGRFHTIENLVVVDGSFMPFAGGVNPTLTIQANALRIAKNFKL